MTMSNGQTENEARPITPMQHLGKRKRTASTEPEHDIRKSAVSVLQILEAAFQLMKRDDPSSIVLRYPLPHPESDVHTIKRQRFDKSDHEDDNIELRMLTGAYESLEELIKDVTKIKSLAKHADTGKGDSDSSQRSLSEHVDAIYNGLSQIRAAAYESSSPQSSTTRNASTGTHQSLNLSSNTILSLRSQTEHGIKQLFSGLPAVRDSRELNAKNLPNGFEFADALSLDKHSPPKKEVRKFAEVFAPPRSAKTLEIPRGHRPTREGALGFVKPFESSPAASKDDFRFASLSTGSWLKYSIANKAQGETGDKNQDQSEKSTSLFKAAFSTFAPSTDNSRSIVSSSDKSQLWLKGTIALLPTETMFTLDVPIDPSQQADSRDTISNAEFEDMIASFLTEKDELEALESYDLLDEISELIEALSSYQLMRDIEIAKGPTSASNPSKDEQDKYELLRTQLQLLLSGLPPFAVAKLNGDQLERLNIKTQIIVQTPEFVGTAQADENTMRRQRVTHTANSAVARNSAPTQTRPHYGTPASAYNAQARAYNNVTSSTYVPRPPAVSYNTPRPATNTPQGTYQQSQYRPNAAAVHTPSIQQFQRSMVNGYGSAPVPGAQPTYVQRPSQPGYQQRAQDGSAYGRVDSSQRPIVNGDMSHYQARPYAVSNHSTPAHTSLYQQSDDALKSRQLSGSP